MVGGVRVQGLVGARSVWDVCHTRNQERVQTGTRRLRETRKLGVKKNQKITYLLIMEKLKETSTQGRGRGHLWGIHM